MCVHICVCMCVWGSQRIAPGVIPLALSTAPTGQIGKVGWPVSELKGSCFHLPDYKHIQPCQSFKIWVLRLDFRSPCNKTITSLAELSPWPQLYFNTCNRIMYRLHSLMIRSWCCRHTRMSGRAFISKTGMWVWQMLLWLDRCFSLPAPSLLIHTTFAGILGLPHSQQPPEVWLLFYIFYTEGNWSPEG